MQHESQGLPNVFAPSQRDHEFDAHIGAITEAADALDGVEELPVGEHAARFETLHDALTEALSAIESA
jgi:hypothetical protein